MSDRIDYKGHVIEARPKQMADSEEWRDDGFLEIHDGSAVTTVSIITFGTYPSREDAVAACHAHGRSEIDRSLLLR